MDIQAFIERDRFAKHNGIEILDARPGYAKARMRLQPYHYNGVNIPHGGAIFTLADLAFAVACNAHVTAVALNVSISYLKAATGSTLFAEAQETTIQGKMGSYTVNITDEAGDVIAVFQGLAYRKLHSAAKSEQ